MKLSRISVVAALACGWSIFLNADTLFLRDGRRVDGELIGIRDGVIEFDANRTFGGRDRVRLNRSEVLRIEFDSGDRSAFGRNEDTRSDTRSDQRPAGMRERDVSV